jgi:hypothetical protein
MMAANKQTLELLEELATIARIAGYNANRFYKSSKDGSEPTDRLQARSVVLARTATKLKATLLRFGSESEATRLAGEVVQECERLCTTMELGFAAMVGGESSEAAKASADVLNAFTNLSDCMGKGCRAMRIELNLPILENGKLVLASQLAQPETPKRQDSQNVFPGGRWSRDLSGKVVVP